MNTRHARVLAAIFAKPTRANITWSELIGLMRALGAELDLTREGSRASFILHDDAFRVHKPHPGHELRKYQVEAAREFLAMLDIRPAA